jgi:hypothetical protein
MYSMILKEINFDGLLFFIRLNSFRIARPTKYTFHLKVKFVSILFCNNIKIHNLCHGTHKIFGLTVIEDSKLH